MNRTSFIDKNMSIGRLIITLLMIMIAVVGGTLAWITYSSRHSALVLTIGDINNMRITLSPYQINGSIVPGPTYSSGVFSEVEISKGNNDLTFFTLFYKINELDSILIDKGLSYTIVNTKGTTNTGDDVTVKTGTFKSLLGEDTTNIPDQVIILDANTDVEINAGTSIYYRVYLWVNSSLGSQEEIQGSKLNVELNASIDSNEAVDDIKPIVTIGTLSGTSISLSYSDSVGVTKYYFGTSDPSTTNVTWTDVTSVTSGSVSKTASSAGTYYFAAQDAAGNIGVDSFNLVVATFYYYNGSAQTSTNSRCVIKSGSSSCNFTIPSAVSSSTGPNAATYYGVSTITSSSIVTTTYTSSKLSYYAVYKGSWTATYAKGTGVNAIGSTSNSCTNYKTTNGTTYSSTNCSVTLPTITAESGYNVLGWYNSSDTKVGDAGASLTLSANGTFTAMAKQSVYSEELLNGAAPILSSGMIPITIGGGGVATTVDPLDSSWYSYENKQWANAVLVTTASRSSYYQSDGVTIKPNVEVPEENILAYYVWIPKYSYKINTRQTAISISFNSTPSGYISHPAFTFDGDNPGFWVGKFETSIQTTSTQIWNGLRDNLTCVSETCVNADKLVVKPEFPSKINDNVSTQFYLTRSMERTGNAFGLVASSVDTHMMKNSEWGAVAYLSNSVYGINKQIRLNNYLGEVQTGPNSYIIEPGIPRAGRGACQIDSDSTAYWEINYFGGAESGCDEDEYDGNIYDSDMQYPQSTTGNITGVFDMAGGAWENVMGYYTGANSNYASNPSGYFGWTSSSNDAGFTGLIDSKYWDQYTKSGLTLLGTACNGSICYGHALSEMLNSNNVNWYNDSSSWLTSGYAWVSRGGYADGGSDAGIFAFASSSGKGDYYTSWRTVIFSFDN